MINVSIYIDAREDQIELVKNFIDDDIFYKFENVTMSFRTTKDIKDTKDEDQKETHTT